MNIFIVYCHPSENSFTAQVRDKFVRGLKDAWLSYEISDLYKMGFNAEFSEKEYLREAFYRNDLPLDEDVLLEQEKIQRADSIVFIYPVFWTEGPAKLVGWFDRVWTCGFAYGENRNMKLLEKALFIAIAGKTLESLQETGEAKAMATVMLGDRIRDRAKEKEMVILDSTTRWDMDMRDRKAAEHLKRAYELGKDFANGFDL